MHEQKKRSFVKAATWRALATTATMCIVWVYTRELALSLGVGVVEVVVKMFLYYGHERVWSRLGWGRAFLEPPIDVDRQPRL
jgi:adenylylsulfate kinase